MKNEKELVDNYRYFFDCCCVVISYFAKWQVADVAGFAVTMFGAELTTANLWNKRGEIAKTWLQVLSLVLIGIFVARFGGIIAESLVTTIIASVSGFVAIVVAGLIVFVVANKSN